jgi:hypothetical protein
LKRRTTTSQIVDLLALGRALSAEAIEFLLGEPRNRVTAALHVLAVSGAIRQLRNGRFRSTPGRDTRVRAIEFIVDPITRNRTGSRRANDRAQAFIPVHRSVERTSA